MADLNQFFDDAAKAINMLVEVCKRLQKERDAAVEDIRMLGRMGQNVCPVCAHYNHGAGTRDVCPKCMVEDCFEWRGLRER